MLSEQEKADLHTMATEWEDAGTPEAWRKLRTLADATGEEWERLVQAMLLVWRAQRRSEDSGKP